MLTKLFPTIMIVLCFCAAGSYAINDWTDWRNISYWIGAAVLNIAVTY